VLGDEEEEKSGGIPLGRKSLPTMFSRQDDFPLDCEPMTVIWGRSIGFWTPTVAKASWSLLTVLMSSGSMIPPTPGMPSISDMLWTRRNQESRRGRRDNGQVRQSSVKEEASIKAAGRARSREALGWGAGENTRRRRCLQRSWGAGAQREGDKNLAVWLGMGLNGH
jgi:hypothetical protein